MNVDWEVHYFKKYRVSIFEFRERESCCRDVDDNFRTRKSEKERDFPFSSPSPLLTLFFSSLILHSIFLLFLFPLLRSFFLALSIISSCALFCKTMRFFLLPHFLDWNIYANILSLNYFIVLHTSASLALNESWDPDVR